MEELSGGRMHYMFNRVGGLKEDMPAGWLDRCGAAIRAVRSDPGSSAPGSPLDPVPLPPGAPIPAPPAPGDPFGPE